MHSQTQHRMDDGKWKKNGSISNNNIFEEKNCWTATLDNCYYALLICFENGRPHLFLSYIFAMDYHQQCSKLTLMQNDRYQIHAISENSHLCVSNAMHANVNFSRQIHASLTHELILELIMMFFVEGVLILMSILHTRIWTDAYLSVVSVFSVVFFCWFCASSKIF